MLKVFLCVPKNTQEQLYGVNRLVNVDSNHQKRLKYEKSTWYCNVNGSNDKIYPTLVLRY